ncbi:protein RRNAD1 [Nephila pilipes]|uniref:Protein RRNAD1 n=1 Tax=Nephila pilipes TaxID=299642 RepID=A0A8X6TTP7_NEPPI|nr:protein RRNAD1 [Nephila pilipes]
MEPRKNIFVCDEETIDQAKKYANMCSVFLKNASFLTEAYILDYFVERLWTRLPAGWLEVISKFDIDDLESFIDLDKDMRYERPWPLSLLAFRASASTLTLPRKSISSPDAVKYFLEKNFNLKNYSSDDSLSEETEWSFSANEFENKSGQHKNIPEFCRRHVKPKKQHEIFRMAEITDVVLKYFDLKHVIDVGAGQGHLSRFLALCYDLKVATIEADLVHVSDALQFDKQALASFEREKKYKYNENEDIPMDMKTLPHHVEEKMTVSSSDFCLEKVFNDAWQEDSYEEMKFAIMGLHTCGNLAETILKTFVKCDHSQVLLSIGCCYMKIEGNKDCEGYPLSNFVKALPNNTLSYEAKEMACHALEMYIKRLQDNAPALKIHCYRATLEKCIVSLHPNIKHYGLRGVKHAELLPFQEYAKKALSKVKISLPEHILTSPDVEACLAKWKDVLIFYSLRLITAPIVESLILIDRLIYLYEQGHPGCIVPIFDASLSPRNQLLLSAKHL